MIMNRYIDTHMHLDLANDYKKMVGLIEKNNMMVISMTNHPTVYRKFSKMVRSDNIRIALGFHPEVIGQHFKYLDDMLSLIPEVRYIGEIGLDLRNKSSEDKNSQILSFEKIIMSCHECGGKLISIHSRGSVSKILSIIPRKFSCSVIMHWYSGNEKNLVEAIQRGYYFSINLSMMSSNKITSILKLIPKSRLLIETDFPFIDNNEEEYMKQIFKTVTELSGYYNVEEKVILNQINYNFSEIIKATFT